MFAKHDDDDGFEVETASDGEEALRKIQETNPDLVLLDIRMPKLSGLEVLKKLKSQDTTKHIPVIMLTNQGEEQVDMDAAISMGAASYLVKSDTALEEVLQKVREVLGGHTKSETKMF